MILEESSRTWPNDTNNLMNTCNLIAWAWIFLSVHSSCIFGVGMLVIWYHKTLDDVIYSKIWSCTSSCRKCVLKLNPTVFFFFSFSFFRGNQNFQRRLGFNSVSLDKQKPCSDKYHIHSFSVWTCSTIMSLLLCMRELCAAATSVSPRNVHVCVCVLHVSPALTVTSPPHIVLFASTPEASL